MYLRVGGGTQPLRIEGRHTDQEFVEQHTQGVDIGSRVDVGTALGLLGAHVLGRADQLSVFREDTFGGQLAPGRLGDAEVNDLGARTPLDRRDEHIPRLEVAVDDALGMGVLHRVAHLSEEHQPVGDGQPVGIAVGRNGLAGHILHREVGPSVACFSSIQHLRDVRMIHERECLTLPFEPSDHLAGFQPGTQDLERHPAVRLGLLGQVHRAEPALTQHSDERVQADARSTEI